MAKKTTPLHSARCLCGLRTALHYDKDNRKLSCEETARVHRWAAALDRSLADALRESLREGAR